MSNAAIFYNPEAYSTDKPQLMGRNAAGESFLRGYLEYNQAKDYWIQIDQKEFADAFKKQVEASGNAKPIHLINNTNLHQLSNAGVMFYPGPTIASHAWKRTHFGNNAWSLCGITHTTSTIRAMDGIVDLIQAPIQPWDALICTSHAVKENVKCMFQAQADYLNQRFGIKELVLPKLPVIPLAIHTKDFSFNEKDKVAARTKLGIESDAIVILYVGRLSFHAKAHPLPMYQAIEAAANKLKNKKVVLVECGWFAHENINKAFHEASDFACPSIKVLRLDGRIAENRNQAWAGADIFCSLSDNIQESFGITPLEAMATGLPVVVSDWDGYKDTVRDGVDGFRVPTLMPPQGLGQDLSLRYALDLDNYDTYCAMTSSLISVDIGAATEAFKQLIESKALRDKMGRAGQENARKLFDWSAVIKQYESLWADLNAIRKSEQATLQKRLKNPWPARMDPFISFANYPSRRLHEDLEIGLRDNSIENTKINFQKIKTLGVVRHASPIIPSDSEAEDLMQYLAEKPMPLKELISKFPNQRRAFLFRAINWFIKFNLFIVMK
jgi:glycosyltransferase involved in cell wall biosynthesis